MKLCCRCQHFLADPSGIVDHCTRKVIADPVRGTSTYASCAIERSYKLPGCCGPEGDNFVERDEVAEGHHA